MTLAGKRAVVTGGARGIGAALAERFRAEGATVLTADLSGADAVCDVGREEDLRHLIAEAGEIDLFVSNAGVGAYGGPELSDDEWDRVWRINTMSHVWAARLLLPSWIARGHGYFLQTVSAAGLLTQIGSAPYSVTKHAALAFAEWLHITHYDQGIRVSALCPQGVRTQLLDGATFQGAGFLHETALEPAAVAEAAVAAIAEERFLILPHPEVAQYIQNKAGDYERWLRGMRKLQAKWMPPGGPAS
ncbi:MAG: SDR family oxidoreductase [Bryobacteraceae bacterium]|nr:SDR family oxidoreductase [Bryobacteraceae bacterium]